ncbi:hypothetical protein BH10PLA2_BH10PLA2_02880 [soil metagenome]
MTPYANRNGTSGVVAYEISTESITVAFRDGSVYLYTYTSAGKGNIERMKKMAQGGRRLRASGTNK